MAETRVLVVEDEFLIRLILTETLDEAGFVVTEAADGEEAVRLLEQGGHYDVLVTDVQMPGRLDGVAVARHARERFPDMLIIFATGRSDSVRALGKLRACEALVAKPYGSDQILDVIRRMQADRPEVGRQAGERARTGQDAPTQPD